MPQSANSYDPGDGMKTPAERARETFLLNDPLALVLSPTHVECKQCNKKIKLSSKSAFDTFHWRNHRARCVKAAKKKAKAAIPPRRLPSTPHRAATSLKPHPARRTSGTPPLIDISDSEEERRSEHSAEAQSPPCTIPSSPLSIQSPLEIRQSDAILDDYMLRFHPDCFDKMRPSSDHWQAWSWSRLKQPHFLTPAYVSDDEVQNDDDDDDCGPERPSSLADLDSRDRDAAHALSLLSQSH